MTAQRLDSNLHKRFVGTLCGYDVFAVDALAVRDAAKPDEEFGNFATKDEFPNLIPRGEIWLSEKSLNSEGVFFIADALTRMKEKERGTPEETAYTAGLNVERLLRARLTDLRFRAGRPHRRVPQRVYVEHYITLPDARFPVEVWLVDGSVVRSFYKTDYTEGGHGYVYRWVPRQQIWIEKDLDPKELPFIVSHEYLELRLMRDRGLEYDPAHEICSKVEFNLRKEKGATPLLVPGGGRLTKRQLPHLTEEKVFAYVVKTYLKK